MTEPVDDDDSDVRRRRPRPRRRGDRRGGAAPTPSRRRRLARRLRPVARRVHAPRRTRHHHHRRARRHLGADRQRRHRARPRRDVEIAWPLDNSTPWAGPLIVGGALVFLGGIAPAHLGLRAPPPVARSATQPARRARAGKLPSAPKPPSMRRSQVTGGGRRADRRREAHRARAARRDPRARAQRLLGRLLADVRPAPARRRPRPTTPAPTGAAATDAPTTDDREPAIEPAVTVPQMERIMRSIAVVDRPRPTPRSTPTRCSQRFTGPALEARQANYAIRGTLPDHPAPTAIPASPLTLTLPQQVAGWPATGRTVLTIAKNSDDPTVAPTALVLQQATPRENYKIALRDVAGTRRRRARGRSRHRSARRSISPEFKGLVMPSPDRSQRPTPTCCSRATSRSSRRCSTPRATLLREQLGVAGQQAIRRSRRCRRRPTSRSRTSSATAPRSPSPRTTPAHS